MSKVDVKKIEYGYDYRDMSMEQFHELLQQEKLTQQESTLKDLVENVSLTLVRRNIKESWNTPKEKKKPTVDLPEDIEI